MAIKKFADLKEKDKLYLKTDGGFEPALTDKERRKAYGEYLKNGK